jgi:hypothetical protein
MIKLDSAETQYMKGNQSIIYIKYIGLKEFELTIDLFEKLNGLKGCK